MEASLYTQTSNGLSLVDSYIYVTFTDFYDFSTELQMARCNAAIYNKKQDGSDRLAHLRCRKVPLLAKNAEWTFPSFSGKSVPLLYPIVSPPMWYANHFVLSERAYDSHALTKASGTAVASPPKIGFGRDARRTTK